MAKNRYTGKSGQIYIDTAGGTTYAQVTLARNIQLPPASKARIDVTAMEDTAVESRPGLEEESEFSFEVLWDDNDTVDASLRTAFNADSLCGFKAVMTDGTNTWSQEWQGYITSLTPQAFGGSDAVSLQVTGIRKGAISDTFT